MKRANPGLKQISVYLPEELIESLDELVKRGFYPNRSEAIRIAIKDLVSPYLDLRSEMDPTVVNYVKYHTRETRVERMLKRRKI